jgi:hypothetical protein
VAKFGLVLAAMPFHAFFGVIIMSSNRIVADMFHLELDLPWTIDLARSQYVGGGVARATGQAEGDRQRRIDDADHMSLERVAFHPEGVDERLDVAA